MIILYIDQTWPLLLLLFHPPSVPPSSAQTAIRPVRGILHVPSRAITLLSHCLGIKATICFCISDKTLHLFPSTYPSVHTSIVLCPCVCLSFALWVLLHTCAILPVQFLSVTSGCVTERDRVTVLSHIPVALCLRAHAQADTCMTFMHCSFTPASRAQPFGNQRDVTA